MRGKKTHSKLAERTLARSGGRQRPWSSLLDTSTLERTNRVDFHVNAAAFLSLLFPSTSLSFPQFKYATVSPLPRELMR